MLTSYPAYKDSGVPWLGRIPEHWEMLPIKAISKLRNKRGRTDLPLLSVYRDYGVIRKDSRDDNHNRDGEDLSAYKVVKPGYLVANKMKAWQGSLGVSLLEGIVSPAYIVCELSEKVHPKYLHYLLRSSAYITAYNHISYGVRVDQWDMRYNDFKSLPLYLPSEQEQQHIARFLDYKTAKIARFIRSKQRMIALLKEQKQAIINQAVTGQINVSAFSDVSGSCVKNFNANDATGATDASVGKRYPAYKPSGVDYIGEIPIHWKQSPIGRLFSFISGGTPSKDKNEYWLEGSIPWISPKDMKSLFIFNSLDHITDKALEESKLKVISPNSILIVVRGMILAKNVPVAIAKIPLTINQDMKAMIPLQTFSIHYLALLLSNSGDILKRFIEESAHGTKCLRTDLLKKIELPIPPLNEQDEIANFVFEQSKIIDNSISHCEREIALMQEYRARLIADVVTGQRDVRGLAVPDDAAEEDIVEEESMTEEDTEQL